MDMVPHLNNAQCVYGGSKCKFRDIVQCLEGEHQHQFMLGGSMWILPNRISSTTRVSPAMYEEPVVVVGKDTKRSDIKQSFVNLTRPFELGTWILLLVFFKALQRASARTR